MERLEYITQKKEKLEGELNKSIIKKDDISKIHKLESQINELNFQIINFQKKQNNTNFEVKNNINQRSIFNIINQNKK